MPSDVWQVRCTKPGRSIQTWQSLPQNAEVTTPPQSPTSSLPHPPPTFSYTMLQPLLSTFHTQFIHAQTPLFVIHHRSHHYRSLRYQPSLTSSHVYRYHQELRHSNTAFNTSYNIRTSQQCHIQPPSFQCVARSSVSRYVHRPNLTLPKALLTKLHRLSPSLSTPLPPTQSPLNPPPTPNDPPP